MIKVNQEKLQENIKKLKQTAAEKKTKPQSSPTRNLRKARKKVKTGPAKAPHCQGIQVIWKESRRSNTGRFRVNRIAACGSVLPWRAFD